MAAWPHICTHAWMHARTHAHTHLAAIFPGLPGSAGTRKAKPIWILLKQETVSGSGISWAVCKSAPRTRQITTPVPHHSVFYRLDALPAAQPTAPKHWRHTSAKKWNKIDAKRSTYFTFILFHVRRVDGMTHLTVSSWCGTLSLGVIRSTSSSASEPGFSSAAIWCGWDCTPWSTATSSKYSSGATAFCRQNNKHTHTRLAVLCPGLPGWQRAGLRRRRPGFKSQPRRCRVTVLGKLLTPIVPLFTKQQNW